MSVFKLLIGLEEFTEEVNATIAPDVPEVEETQDEQEAVQQESADIDEDLDSFRDSAQALEDVISLVEEAPGAEDKPMEPFVERAVNVAMEAADLSSAGAPTADKSETKGQFLAKAKEFAKKIFDMLANIATKIIEWVKGAWANATDRLVKNANKAKSMLTTLKGMNSRPGAEITNEKLLAAVANAEGDDVGNVIQYIFGYTKGQGDKFAPELTNSAIAVIDDAASGKESIDNSLQKLFNVLADGAGQYDADGNDKQKAAVKAGENTKMLMSEPFFGGQRAWATAPNDVVNIDGWKHGIAVLDEVKPVNKAAPEINELVGICEYLLEGLSLVQTYKAKLGDLDKLQKKLKDCSSKASDKSNQEVIKKMQKLVPQIIKGTQVDAYNYAGSASSIVTAYVAASITAHQATDESKKEA